MGSVQSVRKKYGPESGRNHRASYRSGKSGWQIAMEAGVTQICRPMGGGVRGERGRLF